jgi:hypothetical protein
MRREADAGVVVAGFLCKNRINRPTLYLWRREFDGPGGASRSFGA